MLTISNFPWVRNLGHIYLGNWGSWFLLRLQSRCGPTAQFHLKAQLMQGWLLRSLTWQGEHLGSTRATAKDIVSLLCVGLLRVAHHVRLASLRMPNKAVRVGRHNKATVLVQSLKALVILYKKGATISRSHAKASYLTRAWGRGGSNLRGTSERPPTTLFHSMDIY